MAINVRFPVSLNSLAGGRTEVACASNTVIGCLLELDALYGGLNLRAGTPPSPALDGYSIFVNGTNIRYLRGLESELKSGDELTIIPALAGG